MSDNNSCNNVRGNFKEVMKEKKLTDTKIWLYNCKPMSQDMQEINTVDAIISSTNFKAQFSLFINNMFVTLLSSTCFEH